jgi:predicted nucleic acid-binding Zn ribbon protein
MKPTVVACAFCGKEFTATHPRNVYCSEICQKANKTARQREKYAANKPAKVPKEKKQIEAKDCVVCGRSFMPQRSSVQKTCSKECREKREAELVKENLRKRYRGDRTCEQCGKVFFAEGVAKFCSKACRTAHNLALQEQRKAEVAEAGLTRPKMKGEKRPVLAGKHLARAQGIWVSNMTFEEKAEAARKAGMSYGKWVALQQMKYEKEKGIGFYAN